MTGALHPCRPVGHATRSTFSKRNRPVGDSSCPRCLTDTRAVVTIPHAERGSKLLSGDNCFGTQGRQTLGASNFSYPVTDKAHRQDQDRFGEDQQPPPEFPPMFCRPSPCERAATCRRDAPAEANVVEFVVAISLFLTRRANRVPARRPAPRARDGRRGQHDSRGGEIGVVGQ